MLESLVIGSSATGIMAYLISKIGRYFSQGSTCSNPLFIIDSNENVFIFDSNENELTTVNNRNDTEVLIIHRTPKDILCF